MLNKNSELSQIKEQNKMIHEEQKLKDFTNSMNQSIKYVKSSVEKVDLKK